MQVQHPVRMNSSREENRLRLNKICVMLYCQIFPFCPCIFFPYPCQMTEVEGHRSKVKKRHLLSDEEDIREYLQKSFMSNDIMAIFAKLMIPLDYFRVC